MVLLLLDQGLAAKPRVLALQRGNLRFEARLLLGCLSLRGCSRTASIAARRLQPEGRAFCTASVQVCARCSAANDVQSVDYAATLSSECSHADQ